MDLSVNGCSLSYQAAIIPRLPGKSRTYLQTGFVGMPTQVIVVVVTGGLVVVVVVEVDVEVLVDVLVDVEVEVEVLVEELVVTGVPLKLEPVSWPAACQADGLRTLLWLW